MDVEDCDETDAERREEECTDDEEDEEDDDTEEETEFLNHDAMPSEVR